MTRQTWTAFVSAFFFVGLAVTLAVMPVPFVSWSPGQARDTLAMVGNEPIIKVEGTETYPTNGRLDMTVVSVTPSESRHSLPQALLAYWMPYRDSLPRSAVYAPGQTAEEVEADEISAMRTSQDAAIVAALRAAGQPVVEMPAIFSVTVGGPAHNLLIPGDLVSAVDGFNTVSTSDVTERVKDHEVGDKIVFDTIRDGVAMRIIVTAAESTISSGQIVVGVGLGTGYRYQPKISFDIGHQIGGPSAGLVFALAIYDKVTDGPLLGHRHVAGTGTIDASGRVGPIGGIQEKVAGADQAGATIFLLPAENCPDMLGVQTDLNLVKVASLGEAISAMQALAGDSSAAVPRCG